MPKATEDHSAAPEDFTFRDALFYWTSLLEGRYNKEFLRATKPERTTVSRWRVLAVLSEVHPATVGDIAYHTQIEPAVASRLIDQMEAEGLLAKKIRPTDRRVTEVRITRQGRSEFQRLLPLRRAVFRQAVAGISDEEYATMVRLVRRMIGNLEEASP